MTRKEGFVSKRALGFRKYVLVGVGRVYVELDLEDIGFGEVEYKG